MIEDLLKLSETYTVSFDGGSLQIRPRDGGRVVKSAGPDVVEDGTSRFSLPAELNHSQGAPRVLWFTNVMRQGGTALFLRDAIQSLPEVFTHHVVCMNRIEDQGLVENFNSLGVEVSHHAHITKDILKAENPTCVILNNINPKTIEGEHPWEWITREYMVVYVHHSPVTPWLPGADLDVFNSAYLYGLYDNLHSRIKNKAIIPPGIITSLYADAPRPLVKSSPVVIGTVTSPGDKRKCPESTIDILNRVNRDHSIAFKFMGVDEWPGSYRAEFPMESVSGRSLRDFYRDMDVFLYRTEITDTWGRTVSEAMASGLPVVTVNRGGPAEQVETGLTGFLCANDDEFVRSLVELAGSERIRFEMGHAARIHAMKNFDIFEFGNAVGNRILRRHFNVLQVS